MTLFRYNLDGTLNLDTATGERRETYTIDDIVSFARVWTGWDSFARVWTAWDTPIDAEEGRGTPCNHWHVDWGPDDAVQYSLKHEVKALAD